MSIKENLKLLIKFSKKISTTLSILNSIIFFKFQFNLTVIYQQNRLYLLILRKALKFSLKTY